MCPSLLQLVAILLFALSLSGVPDRAAAQECAGDCNADGAVTIDELVVGRRIAAGEVPLTECIAADLDENGVVELDELDAAGSDASGPCAPPPVTPVPFNPSLPSINAGLITSAPGRVIQLEVSLFRGTQQVPVFATQNYLFYDAPLSVLASEDSQPACQLTGELSEAAAIFAFGPDGCVAGDDCDRVIAFVDGSANPQQIQTETLFRCQVNVAADASPGLHRIAVLSPLVTDDMGTAFLTTAFDGGVQVRPPATPTSTPTATPTDTPTATPSATSTPTPQATSTATQATETPTQAPTPTPTDGASCVGDCNGDDVVDVSELVQGIGVALGTISPDVCPAMNGGDPEVMIDELVLAVRNAIEGCAAAP